ncbi:hypothetical protein MTO96_036364, partial [Rhipicephalus appendiculatus]
METSASDGTNVDEAFITIAREIMRRSHPPVPRSEPANNTRCSGVTRAASEEREPSDSDSGSGVLDYGLHPFSKYAAVTQSDEEYTTSIIRDGGATGSKAPQEGPDHWKACHTTAYTAPGDYIPAMMNEDYDYLLNILIIGNSGAGKTCLLVKFANQAFEVGHRMTLIVDH